LPDVPPRKKKIQCFFIVLLVHNANYSSKESKLKIHFSTYNNIEFDNFMNKLFKPAKFYFRKSGVIKERNLINTANQIVD